MGHLLVSKNLSGNRIQEFTAICTNASTSENNQPANSLGSILVLQRNAIIAFRRTTNSGQLWECILLCIFVFKTLPYPFVF